MTTTTYYRFVLRRDTAANWNSVNPVPLQGEICLETDTKLAKVGDGSTAYNSLAYWLGPLTGLMDKQFGSTSGSILYRGSSAWQVLAPGSSGQVLTAGSSGALSWAAGGGGGSSNAFGTADSPPTLTNFTWLNQGTALANQGSNFISIANRTNDSQLRGLMLAEATTAEPFNVVARLRQAGAGSYPQAGLFFYDSASGKALSLGFQSSNGQKLALALSWSSVSSLTSIANVTLLPDTNWIRIRHDGTSVYMDVSSDGDLWINVLGPYTYSTYMSGLTDVGFYVCAQSGASQATLHSWAVGSGASL